MADTDYFTADNVKRCDTAKVAPYIFDHQERHNQTRDERLKATPPCMSGVDAVMVTADRLHIKEGQVLGNINRKLMSETNITSKQPYKPKCKVSDEQFAEK
ncbi:MAG: hypothetical protein COB33_012770 [Thiotrichaceae bacterium]|nr:hypothetical protein [Thiotrichaceae bacterium]